MKMHITEKKCIKCFELKPIYEFYKRRRGDNSGRHSECKTCSKSGMKKWREKNKDKNSTRARRNWLGYQYKMTTTQYEILLKAQKYVCAICKNGPTGKGNNNKSLHVDHDHATGRTRGLLCSNCNRGLGMFYDNISSLLSAAKYLKKHSVHSPPKEIK